MEYVKERASLCELTKAVRAWERKVEIAEVSFGGVPYHRIHYYCNCYCMIVDVAEDQPSDMASTVSAEQAADATQPTSYTHKNTRSTAHVLEFRRTRI